MVLKNISPGCGVQASLMLFFYIQIITGIKLDKNNTYGHLKLSVWMEL